VQGGSSLGTVFLCVRVGFPVAAVQRCSLGSRKVIVPDAEPGHVGLKVTDVFNVHSLDDLYQRVRTLKYSLYPVIHYIRSTTVIFAMSPQL
jgi:hypothetical protein